MPQKRHRTGEIIAKLCEADPQAPTTERRALWSSTEVDRHGP
jgi:hypothetical protein